MYRQMSKANVIFKCMLFLGVFFFVFSIKGFSVNAEEWNSDNMPCVEITTVDGTGNILEKATGYVPAKIKITAPGFEKISAGGSVKVRGNSTSVLPKKPYAIKFEKKQDVLGMGKAKKWVLLANYYDKSFMRNYIAFSLAEQLRINYTSSFAYTDVYMDGRYLGNYLLIEPVEEGSMRVDIDLANGDFMLEYEREREDEGEYYFYTSLMNFRFILKAPEQPTTEQLIDVQKAICDLETAIISNDMNEIAKYLDVDSFVDFYVFNEYIKTGDFGYSSVKFYYEDGRFYAGPPWDYDLSMGLNLDSAAEDIHCQEIWYKRLMQNRQFEALCICRYIELQDAIQEIYGADGLIDRICDKYWDAFLRDHDQAGWSQKSDIMPELSTSKINVNYLRTWLEDRNKWLWEYWDCDNPPLDYRAYYKAIERTIGLTAENFSKYVELESALNFSIDDLTDQDLIDNKVQEINNILEEGEITGCIWDRGHTVTAATCQQDGLRIYYCVSDGCTQTRTEVVKGLEGTHNYEEEIITEATVKEAGARRLTCQACGEIKEEVIPRLEKGWTVEDGVRFWYENGVKQGVRYLEDGTIDLSYRGKEIYDPESGAWYWLDAVQQGTFAANKDVYMESRADRMGKIGKWVRYDAEGHMVKGWDTNEKGTYYFDPIFGTMMKGRVVLAEKECLFDEHTGIGANGWVELDGTMYWYENGVRQGCLYNEEDEPDLSYRGKEIYDPKSDAWYWLDNVLRGAIAKSKDVYQESAADDKGNLGKWVRYDENGHMIKGWHTNENGTYYFDPIYGTMEKGNVKIDGEVYHFDPITGILFEYK